MFSTDFIFRQQESLVDNQKCQAEFRPLCNKIPLLHKQATRTKHFDGQLSINDKVKQTYIQGITIINLS